MPRVHVYDYQNTRYEIATRDWKMIGPWLAEMVELLGDPSPVMPPLQIAVFPMWDREGNPDWPLKPDRHVFDTEGAKDLIATIRTLFGISEDV